LVTLGCARNEVDSEELAGRLAADGWALVDDPASADLVVVNTCGFIEAAKKDSIDTVLAVADLPGGGRAPAVVAVGCLAQRYGAELAAALPEAAAVLGFDSYPEISARLAAVLSGEPPERHVPRDRRELLPITPIARRASLADVAIPGHGALGPVSPAAPADPPPGVAPASGPRPLRRRLSGSPVAPLKIASGCDRRCSFCAIPSFRGAFVSRTPGDVVAEARWLAGEGVREVVLVSENSTSYGKDLGDLRLLERLLPEIAAIEGIDRVRVSYLQPAEMRPSLIDVMTMTPGVVPYFDLSFQHASPAILRRMRRFGGTERFLELIAAIRERDPEAGIRSNVIVGFPGETEDDLAELGRFLSAARLDAVGVFGYSDEDGTEAATHAGKLAEPAIAERVARLSVLVEELAAQRAEDRVGTIVDVLVEETGGALAEGRCAHQAPEVDGATTLVGVEPPLEVGELVRARVAEAVGVDLVAQVIQ
jgi:ribosomal protein S12 methylthiotransferase